MQHLKEFYLRGYNALQSVKSQPMFQTDQMRVTAHDN